MINELTEQQRAKLAEFNASYGTAVGRYVSEQELLDVLNWIPQRTTQELQEIWKKLSQELEVEKEDLNMQFKDSVEVELIQSMGGDHMIVAAAKVSTNGTDALEFAKEGQGEANKGLINYLIKHRHGTPFEHSALTFFVHAPIFVWREWHRHRIGFSYNEESGRYKTLEPVFYIPARDRPMMKVESWKPGRPKFLLCEDDSVYNTLVANLKNSYQYSYKTYLDNLALDIDPGLARDCLPVGIYSGCWVTCNPRSLMSFISLRTHKPEEAMFVSYPLWEIELAAKTCEQILAAGWPITYEAFKANKFVAP